MAIVWLSAPQVGPASAGLDVTIFGRSLSRRRLAFKLRGHEQMEDQACVRSAMILHRPATDGRPRSDRVEVFRLGRDLAVLDPLDGVDQFDVARRGHADLAPLLGNDAVDEVNLGAAAFVHVLAHRGARQIAAGVRVQRGEDRRLDLVERPRVAFRGARQGFRLVRPDVLELIAERLPDAHALAGEPDAEPADLLVAVHLVAGHAGGGGDPVGHAVDAQLRPALAPQISRRLDAVDRADYVGQFLQPLGDAAMDLAYAVDLVG